MTPTDWEARYQSGDMPWEKGEASPGLVDFLAAHPELPRGAVAVPGCGTGHDAREWAKGGFETWGFDLAPSAIRLSQERTATAGLEAHFTQSDFLNDNPPREFDWLFEHTLYCAINRAVKGVLEEELIERFAPHFELLQGWVPRSYPNRFGLELMLWWRRKQAE